MIDLAIVLYFTFFIHVMSCEDELIAVVQIFRHGERAPRKFYKTDPYSDLEVYFEGLDKDELTNEGKRQQYNLGQLTRFRYSKFLPITYSASDIFVQTTDVDRTHMSAQANLYGLFPVAETEEWKTGVTWQPIPIHPSNQDVLIMYPICLIYPKLLEDVYLSDEFVSIDKKYIDVYEYLSKYSGENVTSFNHVIDIFDCLKIEDDKGYSLPNWTSLIYPYPLKDLAGIYLDFIMHTTKMKRLFIGPLLNEIITYFENMAKNSSYSQKFKMYSGHDSNVAGILNALGAFNPPFPLEFSSTLWLELWFTKGAHIVKVYFKNGDIIEPVTINGCSMDCPLQEIRELLNGIIVDVHTRNDECNAVDIF